MASTSHMPTHDYTEGASEREVSSAIANSIISRRESQYSDDADGAVFDGPGHEVNPTTVSRMPVVDRDRRSSSGERRRSFDSHRVTSPKRRERRESLSKDADRRPRAGDEEESEALFGQVEEDLDTDVGSSRMITRQRRSSSPTFLGSSVLENLTQLFRRSGSPTNDSRRPSLSHRSTSSGRFFTRSRRRSDAGQESPTGTDETDLERWGYSSGEEDSEEQESAQSNEDAVNDADSAFEFHPPTPPGALPLLASDHIFGGETRIPMDNVLQDLGPPPPGPPSRQIIYLSDEDRTIRFVGYEPIRWRATLWKIASFATFGVLWLLGHWFPRFWLRWVTQEKAFTEIQNGHIVVETTLTDITMFRLQSLIYRYPLSTVFPFSVRTSGGDFLNRRLSVSSSRTTRLLDSGDDTCHILRFLDYRYARYVLDPKTGLFVAMRDWREPSWTGLASVRGGLQDTTRRQRLTLLGKNELDIPEQSLGSLLRHEIVHPFYVFQIASIILWSIDDYYYYAFCIAVISIFSIMTTLLDTKKTIRRMREMSRFSCTVNVLINGVWEERESTDLVPGDIVKLSQSQFSLVPADLFLLSGDAIINESMLTGESVPVSKTAVKDNSLSKWKEGSDDVGGDTAKSFLHYGTKIVRIRGGFVTDGSPEIPAIALVVRTGFYTTKGALTRSMLYPKPMGFKFYRDSIRFIGVLAGVAVLAFCASVVQFIRLGVPWSVIIVRGLDLITTVVPPALPATLSIGTSFALSRLRKSGIFCIAPARVNVGGKVNVCCFDKTGTLTEDGLDVLGVRTLDRHTQRFGELIEDVRDLPSSREKASFMHALASCHSLKMLDDNLIGDPLDMKMFEFTRWVLEEGRVTAAGIVKDRAGDRPTALVQLIVRPSDGAQFKLEDALRGGTGHAHFLELGVIRTFEFVSSLRRMSVIVKRLKSSSMEIYVKGAPEVMGDICDRSTFPEDYDDILSYYTKRGYRVIAMAGKSIENLSWLKAQKMKRAQAESELKFLGLIFFENKLKPGTTPVIQTLRAAHLACRMITGDNPLTAVSVARECKLINQTSHIFAPAFAWGNATTQQSQLDWSCMDDASWKLDGYTLKPLPPPPHYAIEEHEFDHLDYSLVITGDVFRWMLDHAPSETLQNMLVRAQVYARMSPDEKNEVVERLQLLGFSVLMCGDGANDCAALKAADVGISLSEAEASIAAPFTSATPDISCVVEVVKEGRAALVTSFSCFKYMALYSFIQFTSVTLLYTFASSLGDRQFLYIDLFLIIPIAVAMGRTLPYPKIYTKRPTAGLVSNKVLTSVIGQILITSLTQFWVFRWVKSQPWYIPPGEIKMPRPPPKKFQLQAINYENSTLFLVSCFQYILVAAVFSIGPPFRKPMWTNGWLMFAMFLLLTINLAILLFPPKPLFLILDLMNIPFSARTTLLSVVVVNSLFSIVFERWGSVVVSQIIEWMLRYRRDRKRWREGKAYKRMPFERSSSA